MKKILFLTYLAFAYTAYSNFDEDSSAPPHNKILNKVYCLDEGTSLEQKPISYPEFRAFITVKGVINPHLRQTLFSVYLTLGQEKLKGNSFSCEAIKGRCKLREVFSFRKEAELNEFIKNVSMGPQEWKEEIKKAGEAMDKGLSSSLFSLCQPCIHPAETLRKLFKDPSQFALYEGNLYERKPINQNNLSNKRSFLSTTEELEDSVERFAKRQKTLKASA